MGVAGFVGLAGCMDGAGDGSDGDSDVALETVSSGYTAPVDFVEKDGRYYVADQDGRLYVVEDNGKSVILDVRDRMVEVSGYSERGLLGFAFHPGFPDDPRLYVRYSAPPTGGYSHLFVLSEFTMDSSGDVDPGSERRLLEIREPQPNHNSGYILFGPDDYLYIGVGDGGGANDVGGGHVQDWYDGNNGGNGQDVEENLLGSVLRIDVDGGDPYGVPSDNPLVGGEGLDEHFAWGFRNPWGMSFDSDGRFFVADVGQDLFEEVNVVERGGNYGWNVREGRHCFDAANPRNPPEECPRRTPEGERLRDPVIEYPHSSDGEVYGTAVVGGYLYENNEVTDLQGQYVFGDWGRSFAADEGSIFAATPEGDQWGVERLAVAGGLDRYVLGFGRDSGGELYVLTSRRAGVGGSSGEVNRLVTP